MGAFLWPVSGPRFQDEAFLEDAVTRYRKYIKLMAMHPGEVLVPTYQIDLAWHSAMQSFHAYKEATRRFGVKDLVDHDDSVNDRFGDSKLNRATAVTKRLWLEAYGEPFAVRGAMYRGEPPLTYFHPSWTQTTYTKAERRVLKSIGLAFFSTTVELRRRRR